MATTAEDIAAIRRMTNEESDGLYSDAVLTSLIEANPVPDSEGRLPSHEDWEATYDLNATASQIWAEKAGRLTGETDFAADGGSYSRSQLYEMAIKQSRFYQARAFVRTMEFQRPRVKNRYSGGYSHGAYDVAATHGTH